MPADRITRVARLRRSEQFREHLARIGADLPLADASARSLTGFRESAGTSPRPRAARCAGPAVVTVF